MIIVYYLLQYVNIYFKKSLFILTFVKCLKASHNFFQHLKCLVIDAFSFVLGIWGSVWGINLQTIVKQLRKYQVCCCGDDDEEEEEEPVNNEAQRVIIGKELNTHTF